MEQEAIVARVDGDQAYIEVGGDAAGCGRCHEAGGCRSGLFSQMFRVGPRQFRIANNIGAAPGDRVVVSVADGAMWRAALWVYLVPVLCVIVGAFVGTALDASADADVGAVLGAMLGLVAGVFLGFALRRGAAGDGARPVLMRRSPHNCVAKEACP